MSCWPARNRIFLRHTGWSPDKLAVRGLNLCTHARCSLVPGLVTAVANGVAKLALGADQMAVVATIQ